MNGKLLFAFLGVVFGNSGVTALILMLWARDKRECASERKQLIDRIIARHTGEVIALDRTDKRPTKQVEPDKLIEGLS